jgi:hypothetical protein
MEARNRSVVVSGSIAALLLVLALAPGASAYSESRGIETLRESGTNTQPYTRTAPSGNSVHYYVPNAYYNPYTSQRDNRVGPPVGFGPNTQGNWYGNTGAPGSMGYPNQRNLDLYNKERR